jgi:exodeoxyribonuclease VII small subunit
MAKQVELTFEAALSRLEEIVAALERGELTLDQSIARFEEGVALASRCSDILKASELKVQKLVKKANEAFQIEPLDAGEDAEEGADDA